ncbi:unnamed protein product, partial [Ilex paraguariensis]
MTSSDPNKRPRPGPRPTASESATMPPSSWAKHTGFKPKLSGETSASDSSQIMRGRVRAGSAVNGEPENGKVPPAPAAAEEKDQTLKKKRDSDGGGRAVAKSTTGKAATATRKPVRKEKVVGVLSQTVDDNGFVS